MIARFLPFLIFDIGFAIVAIGWAIREHRKAERP